MYQQKDDSGELVFGIEVATIHLSLQPYEPDILGITVRVGVAIGTA